MRSWNIQDAKARFSELVNRARKEGPQVVAKRGEEAVVVLDVKDYRNLIRRKGKEDLASFFKNSPLAKIPPEFLERDRDEGRKVDL